MQSFRLAHICNQLISPHISNKLKWTSKFF